MTNKEKEESIRKQKSIVDDAYWKFTRCANSRAGSYLTQMLEAQAELKRLKNIKVEDEFKKNIDN